MGNWVWGLLLVTLGALILAAFVSLTRRLPADAAGLARAPLAALDAVRARAGAAVETVAAHGTARIELASLRHEVGELAAERGHRLRELGEAVYEGNRAAKKELKERLEELDKALARIGPLEERQRRALEAFSVGLVNKLLHVPTVNLKRSFREGQAPEYVQLVRHLFALDP